MTSQQRGWGVRLAAALLVATGGGFTAVASLESRAPRATGQSARPTETVIDGPRARVTRPAPGIAARAERLERWLADVDAYLGGANEAESALAGWDADALVEVVDDVGTAVRSVAGSPRADRQYARALGLTDLAAANRLVKRGVLAHTDVAIGARDRVVPAPRGDTRRALVIFEDGRVLGIAASSVHWDTSRGLLAHVTPDPAHDPDVRQWYLAVAAYLHHSYSLGELQPHLTAALELLPDDGRMLFLMGALHETLASPRVQTTLATLVLPRGRSRVTESERAHLGHAERYLTRALAADPSFHEARFRLGRVAARQGRHEEAVALLDAAAAGLDAATLRYLCALFVGHANDALGRRDAARGAYERAAALYPGAQSPHLALASLGWRTNDRATAVAALDRWRGLPDNEAAAARYDPWWDYHASHARDAVNLLRQVQHDFLAAQDGPQ